MLINVDVKSLEIVVAAFLSGDEVMRQELFDRADIHENNRLKFNLPTRLVAKLFVFRLIYGGSAYSYANDPEFKDVSTSVEFWQEVIDAYYAKYRGMANWHKGLIEQVKRDKKYTLPSGRYFPFMPEKGYGGFEWPITKIKNYPCQGFGADLVMLARLNMRRSIIAADLQEDVLLVSTVHDSIVVDARTEYSDWAARELLASVENVPALCKQVWGCNFDLPLTGEVQYGMNKGEMSDYKFGTTAIAA